MRNEPPNDSREIPSEVLAEYVDDECPTCGAYVLNPALHEGWHRDIEELARRHVPPPVYGRPR